MAPFSSPHTGAGSTPSWLYDYLWRQKTGGAIRTPPCRDCALHPEQRGGIQTQQSHLQQGLMTVGYRPCSVTTTSDSVGIRQKYSAALSHKWGCPFVKGSLERSVCEQKTFHLPLAPHREARHRQPDTQTHADLTVWQVWGKLLLQRDLWRHTTG